jgi:hypothetical protein
MPGQVLAAMQQKQLNHLGFFLIFFGMEFA